MTQSIIEFLINKLHSLKRQQVYIANMMVDAKNKSRHDDFDRFCQQHDDLTNEIAVITHQIAVQAEQPLQPSDYMPAEWCQRYGK